jgi:hypothetical protein
MAMANTQSAMKQVHFLGNCSNGSLRATTKEMAMANTQSTMKQVHFLGNGSNGSLRAKTKEMEMAMANTQSTMKQVHFLGNGSNGSLRATTLRGIRKESLVHLHPKRSCYVSVIDDLARSKSTTRLFDDKRYRHSRQSK